MTGFRLKSVEFRREREKDWQELERLITAAEKQGLRNMPPQDLARLPVYYRAALSSLSVARAISLDANLLLYLENLVNRSFIRVYGVRHHLGEAFLTFLTRRFPAEVRRFRWMIALAFAFFLMGGVSGFVQVSRDADNFYHLVPGAMAGGRNPAASAAELQATLVEDAGGVAAMLNHFASFLFTHNAQIGILSFALGFALGIPVFYLMFFNGQMLGAMSALFHDRGLALQWWGWVLPHGVTELGAIFICGGAGLVLARAVILPGRGSRLDNLAASGRRAGILVLGAVVMLAIAALIEGLFRQLVQDTGVRYSVVGLSLLAWSYYFLLAGRGNKHG